MDILNFDFLYDILENDDEEAKKILFFSLINSLKNNGYLHKYIDISWIKDILNKVEFIEDIYEKADIINFLLSVIYKNEFEIKDKDMENLFHLYLNVLKSGYSVEDDIISTLSLFLNLGISLETIFTECMKVYHNDECIHLFSKLPFRFEVGEYDEEFVFLIKQHKKMMTRFDLVLHFYLITSFDYAENILIAGDYLKKYYNYMIICADWEFDRNYSNNYFILENIITSEELNLLIELGSILDRCKESKQNINIEELFEYTDAVSNQFKLLLKSDEIKSIKKRFFGEKSFFEVAFDLPSLQYEVKNVDDK